MKYQQLTTEDRYTLSTLRMQDYSVTKIASVMGRHRSTIYRELKRNKNKRSGGYVAFEADSNTRGRRRRSRKNRHYTEEHFSIVRDLLMKQWSPEQIVGHIRQKKLMHRNMSHETIYQYIWRDRHNGGYLWKQLRQSPKLRRKRYKAYDSRGQLADKRHITERPKSVETRRYIGHWEIDTVHGRGSKHCIVTLVERKTGYVMIGILNDKTTASLNKKTKMLIRRHPRLFKTITADNGTEFHQYKKIEAATHVKFYFANPYHSWERGSNENMNGLIRQYLPKGQCMDLLTQQECDNIAKKLNTRPRKRYDYKTPEELFYAH
jgi:transposase, IS30 family